MSVGSLRYFSTVGLHSMYLLSVMSAATVAGGVLLMINPSKGAEAIGPVALVQMFAAASGFAVPARRGHLDLLFTSGAARLSIALTHFAVSIAPGVVMWILLGLIEIIVTRTTSPKAFASGTVLVFVLMSGPPWALTIGLPRLSGAIGWLLVMAVWRAAGLDSGGVIGTMLSPFELLGQHLTSDQLHAAWPSIVLAVVLPAVALMRIVYMDVPLESAQ
jgi:hypothetical protein